MNQRIRELVKKAGGEFWQRLENDAVNPEAYITFDPPESLDKFVELIVRECARVIDNADSEGSLDDFAMVYLSEHFGVEE
jgi:hypothetical protein